mmetsp:Transcript_5456/g.24250  ORF Transcript_5456/g.24250 Transcript_5456/m.24250 type:complete len:340 (+) Transcript_5456:112-1131(+)
MDRTAPTFSYIASDDAHTNPLPSWSSSPAAFSSIITLTRYGSLSSLASMAFVVTSISVPGGNLSCICMLYDLGITSGGRGSTARSISAIAACQLPWHIISESITPVDTMPGRPWYASPTVTTLRRALGEASAHRGSLSSTLKDLRPRPDSCALPQTKHCECSSYEAWMESIGLPSTSGMPASAAGCFGELQGLTSWPSCTKRAHSSRERNARGVGRNARRVVVVVENAEESSREVELDLRSHAAPAGDAQPQTHRKHVSVDAAARAVLISRAATASDRARASRAARLATALHMTPFPFPGQLSFVTRRPRARRFVARVHECEIRTWRTRCGRPPSTMRQ